MSTSIETDRVIYHYCDSNALLSILEHKTLRFTHAAFLNDTLEIQHGVGICRQMLEERLKQTPQERLLAQTIQYLDNAELWQYYVCCFSKCKDKLSQWRAYADDGAGFAIGFRETALNTNFDACFGCRSKSVSYDASEYQTELEQLLEKFNREISQLPSDIVGPDIELAYENAASRIAGWIIDHSVFQKGSGFSEEQEWRSVRSYTLGDVSVLPQDRPVVVTNMKELLLQGLQEKLLERQRIRSGRFGITPYIEVAFTANALCEIVCGPKSPKKLTETSLQILRRKYGLTFEVLRSAATYR